MPTYEKIEEIQIDKAPKGMWTDFGGNDSVVFAIDFDIGVAEKPTKFIVSVVNVTGNYVIDESNLSYIFPVRIQFGPFEFKFYLESYRIQKAAGKRILQLTFVDGSTLLDRVYVALMDRDRKWGHYRGARNRAPYEVMPVYFPVLCERPEFYPPPQAPNNLVNYSKVVPMPIPAALNDPASWQHGIAAGGRIEEGGMITVGLDMPTIENAHQDCAIRDAQYTFYHLLYMVELFGIEIGGDFVLRDKAGKRMLEPTTGTPLYADRNPYHYESFGGNTLREVLNQWCKLQGYSWTYAWDTNRIIGIDMYSSTAWAEFEKIKKLVDSVQSQDPVTGKRDNALIEQATETVSLAGTKMKYVTTKAIRSAKPDNSTNQDYFRPIKFQPLDTAHIIAPNQRGRITGLSQWAWTGAAPAALPPPALGWVQTPMYRTNTDLHISCGLANYQGSGGMTAREIFNVAIGCHEATGVEILAEIHPYGNPMISAATIRAMNQFCLGSSPDGKMLLSTMRKHMRYWRIPFRFYFARYTEESKQKWETWEKNIAQTFLGRYYVNFDRFHSFEACDSRQYGVFRRTDTCALGDGQSLGSGTFQTLTRESVGTGLTPFPFSGILKDPYGLRLNPNLFVFFDRFNLLTRTNATFETTPENIARVLKPGGVNVLEQWQPKFLECKGMTVFQWIGRLFPHLLRAGGGGVNFPVWPAGMASGFGSVMSANQIMLALQAQIVAGAKAKTKIGIYFHPDYSHPNFPWKIFDVDYTRYENLKEESIETSSSFLQKSYSEKCPLLCGGISPRQQMCEGLKHLFKPRPWPSGLERINMGAFGAPYWTLPAFGFKFHYDIPPANNLLPWTRAEEMVVFPTWTSYAANHKSHQFRRIIEPRIMHIINGLEESGRTPGNVSKIEIIANDVSKFIEPNITGSVKISLPFGSANPLVFGANLPALGKNKPWDAMTIRKLHNDYGMGMELPITNAIMAKPRKSLSCTVAGINFGDLLPYMQVGGALEACSVRLGKDGVACELKFSNKPPATLDDSISDAAGASIQTDIVRTGGLYPMY